MTKVATSVQDKQSEVTRCRAENAQLLEQLAALQSQVDDARTTADAARNQADLEAKKAEGFEKHVMTLSASVKSMESAKADAVAEIKSAQVIAGSGVLRCVPS